METNKISDNQKLKLVDKKERFIAAIKENECFIYKIASVYTNNIEDKNDVVQEILYQLWKSFDSFNQKSSLNTWMYRVALNVAVYQLKVFKKTIPTLPLVDHASHHAETNNNDQEDNWKILRQQIDALNLLDKGIVLLYLEDKSYEEIATIVGITKTNVATKLSRIKEKLKTQIHKNL